MIIDPSLRDMILFIYHHFHNLSSGSGGGGNVTTSQLNTALADKIDKGGYTGTAQDLKNAIDTVDSKTIHWNDVQNKPELDFIPTSWNKKNGGTIIDTSGEDWLEINAEDFSNEGVSFGKSSLRTTAHYEAVDKDDNNKSTRVGPSFILFDRNAAIVKETGRTIAFEDFNLSGEYVYVKVAGVKINDNSVGNRLLLDNGETKPLTDFATATRLNEVNEKVSNIKVGGRNYVLNSNDIHNSLVKSYPISKDFIKNIHKGDSIVVSLFISFTKLVSLGINGRIGAEFQIYYVDNTFDYVWSWVDFSSYDIGKGYNGRFSFVNHHIKPNKEILRVSDNIGLHVQCEVEGLSIGMPKIEIGNIPTDWTPAPEDILEQKIIYVDTPTLDITSSNINRKVHIANDCVLNYNTMPELSTITVRKVYNGGSITFSGSIAAIYTGDTVLNGNNGSIATIDYGLNNKIFIDIKNI